MGKKYIVTMNVNGQMEQKICSEWSEVAELILGSDGNVHILCMADANDEPFQGIVIDFKIHNMIN